MIRLELVILPIALIVLVAIFLIGVWDGRRNSEYGMWGSRGSVLSLLGGILGGFVLIALVICLVPFQPHYWSYQEQHGQIESISNRFQNASGDISTNAYVLSVNGRSLVVEDPRVLNYSVGDDIDLNCLPTWVYGAKDRIFCNII